MTGTDETAALRAAVLTMFERFAQGDIAGMEEVLADDCTLWDLATPRLIAGPAERNAFHDGDREQSRARGALTWEVEFLREDVWGDVGLVCYTYDFAYAPPNPAAVTVRITDVLRRVDGAWSIVHHHEGPVPDGAVGDFDPTAVHG